MNEEQHKSLIEEAKQYLQQTITIEGNNYTFIEISKGVKSQENEGKITYSAPQSILELVGNKNREKLSLTQVIKYFKKQRTN